MDLADSPQEAAYRQRVRDWLADNRQYAPPDREVTKVVDTAPFRAWQRRLFDAGFVGITWPVEYEGRGLGPAEQVVLDSELVKAGVPGPFDMVGVGGVGPTLIAHGAPVQRDRYLGNILRATEVWCQLFTEPTGGSDLAAVQTRALRRDDGWEVTGHKVWTTHGHQADLGILLARTDPDVPKHQGLTAFVVPMTAAGVRVQPLRQMSGYRDFNEITLDHVELSGDAVIGGVGAGWQVALTLLGHERFGLVAGLGSMGLDVGAIAASVAGTAGASADPHTRHRAAAVIADLHALRFGGYRAVSSVSQGKLPNPAIGLGKITTIDAVTRACQLMVEGLGPAALDGEWGVLLAQMPGLRAGGGTQEILLTTVGEQALGLPREQRGDKHIPFRELDLNS
jgi:alkylation response protein AidB-like acyl-CoA dehydrogenase